MDLQTVKLDNEPVDLKIIHPVTEEETDVVFKVLGLDSDEYKAIDRQITKRFIDKYSRSGTLDIKRVPHSEAEKSRLERACVLVKGWENLMDKGKELEYNKENCEYVLTEYPFILEQVMEFCADRANFIKASSKN